MSIPVPVEDIKSFSVRINQLNIPATDDENQTVYHFVHDLIDQILWLEGGEHDQTKSVCSTPSEVRRHRYNEQNLTTDNRLQYWQNYLKSRETIKANIICHTKKCNENEILFNRNLEANRTNLIKRLINVTERLDPNEVERHNQYLTLLKRYCNREIVHETLPKLELTGKKTFEIVDMPNVTRAEQGIDNTENINSWLNSKYLSKKISAIKYDIQELIKFYPDLNDLYVVGEKKEFHKRDIKTTNKCTDSFDIKSECIFEEKPDSFIQLRIVDADSIRPREKLPNYSLTINGIMLDFSKPTSTDLEFNVTFETTVPYEKQKLVLLNIKNTGTKTIYFNWCPIFEKLKKISQSYNSIESQYPVFYFDKNSFCLAGGQYRQFSVYFSSKRNGIFSEKWQLDTEPIFFRNFAKISILLFGSCEIPEDDQNKYYNLKNKLHTDGNQNMTDYLLRLVMLPPIPLAVPEPPYVLSLKEEEIFTNMYPRINYSETYMTQLKDLYHEMRMKLPLPSPYPVHWNLSFDIIKEMISALDSELERYEYYQQYLDIILALRNVPTKVAQDIFEDQNYLMVRSIVLTALERIDLCAIRMKEAILQTNLDLDFNEVVVTDCNDKPSLMKFKMPTYETLDNDKESLIDDQNESIIAEPNIRTTTQFDIIKSNTVKEKMIKIFEDSLHLQIAKHLSEMCDEIVTVLETNKNLIIKQ